VKRIDVNLASRPFGNQILPGLVLGVLGLAAIAFSATNVYFYATRARDAEAFAALARNVEAELGELKKTARLLDDSLKREAVPVLNRHVELANGLLARRGLSWTRLFNRLESVQPYGVQLESVSPDAGGSLVVLGIMGEAKKYADMLEYIDRLEASPYFTRVFPRHENLTTKGTFRFLLVMDYHPGEGEREGEGVPEAAPAGETAPAAAPAGVERFPAVQEGAVPVPAAPPGMGGV